jgi:Tfp pilus assembly protein PilN
MIRINLLPAAVVAERKRRAAQARMMRLAALAAVVLACGVGAFYMLTLQIKKETAAVVQQRMALEAEIAAYQPVVQLQATVNSRAELLKAAMGNEFSYRNLMVALGINIPNNVWLTNVTVSREGEQGSLVLRGLTYDHPSTAKWVSSLQAAEGISDVRISYSAAEEIEDEDLIRFELRAQVGTGEIYEPLKRGE